MSNSTCRTEPITFTQIPIFHISVNVLSYTQFLKVETYKLFFLPVFSCFLLAMMSSWSESLNDLSFNFPLSILWISLPFLSKATAFVYHVIPHMDFCSSLSSHLAASTLATSDPSLRILLKCEADLNPSLLKAFVLALGIKIQVLSCIWSFLLSPWWVAPAL